MAIAFRGGVSLRTTALVMAFGAGAIIAAPAYQLVLPGVAAVQDRFAGIGVGMGVGALTFYLADRWVDGLGGGDRLDFDGGQSGGSGLAILLGSLLDGVPESLVLGLTVAHATQISIGFVFAVAISNVPQGLAEAPGCCPRAGQGRRSRACGSPSAASAFWRPPSAISSGPRSRA
jgi:ZIP family zinc transporter